MKNNSGFTLIELIIVIAVIGIMAAVAVPKFFDINSEAHNANKSAVIGTIKTALNNYAAQQLAQNGARAFPVPASFTLASMLDESPDGWTYSSPLLSYDGDDTTYSYDSDGSTYTLE